MKHRIQKIIGCALLLALSICGAAGAQAQETITLTPTLIEEAVCDARALALPGEAMLLYGQQPSETPPHTDAYAVAVDGAGQRLWSLRIGEAQADNRFSAAWMLPDGRILLKLSNRDGTWGTQYYLVSAAGAVQGMLPADHIRGDAIDTGVHETLQPVPGGYLGGGVSFIDGAFDRMRDAVDIAHFDEALGLRWRITSDAFLGANLPIARAAADGFLLAGSQTVVIDPVKGTVAGHPYAVKLDQAGEIVWQYHGHDWAVAAIGDLWPTADGGALFTTNRDPSLPAPAPAVNAATLSKLDASGQLAWMRQYLQSDGYAGFGSLVPYGAGYLLVGYPEGETLPSILHVSATGDVLGQFELALPPHEFPDLTLIPLADGGVLLSGNVVNYGTPNEWGSREMASSTPYYLRIDEPQ
ncbi:MAG: hypothetical protein LBN04_04325 [Oscillospiraceae bacterium]|jgi:hypothetical protein|nr:hypothetical protein [Oscillospiraceae bacterium]